MQCGPGLGQLPSPSAFPCPSPILQVSTQPWALYAPIPSDMPSVDFCIAVASFTSVTMGVQYLLILLYDLGLRLYGIHCLKMQTGMCGGPDAETPQDWDTGHHFEPSVPCVELARGMIGRATVKTIGVRWTKHGTDNSRLGYSRHEQQGAPANTFERHPLHPSRRPPIPVGERWFPLTATRKCKRPTEHHHPCSAKRPRPSGPSLDPAYPLQLVYHFPLLLCMQLEPMQLLYGASNRG